METIAAGKFKATCLAVLDQVQSRRETVVVTKNGTPVAQLVPMPLDGPDPLFGFYRGKLEIVGDVVAPAFEEDEWSLER